MSRNINVNPGNYKVAGRERQGEDIDQASQKGAYAQQREEARREAIGARAGLPAWETTPPNMEIRDRPKPRARKAKGTRTAKRSGASARKTVPAPKRKARRATQRGR